MATRVGSTVFDHVKRLVEIMQQVFPVLSVRVAIGMALWLISLGRG